jgi:hypothetical protein
MVRLRKTWRSLLRKQGQSLSSVPLAETFHLTCSNHFPTWLMNLMPRVPKELISRFVKLCPTCRVRRGTARTSPTGSDKGSPDHMDTQSPPEMLSPPDSRGSSIVSGQCSLSSETPFRQTTYNAAFQSQNRWMSSAPQAQSYSGPVNVLIPAPSHTLGSNVGPLVHYSTSNLQTIDGHHTVMEATYLGNQATRHHQTYSSCQ